jgi:hypothetical protein
MKKRRSDTFHPQHLRDYGKLRVVYIKDGYYVVGRGRYISVDSKREGEDLIAELEKKKD